MKKAAAIFSFLAGLGIIGFWIMALIHGQVPELETEPTAIKFHLSSEFLMASLLLAAGCGALAGRRWGIRLFTLSIGMMIYALINAAGYYGQRGEWTPVAVFLIMIVVSFIFAAMVFTGKIPESDN